MFVLNFFFLKSLWNHCGTVDSDVSTGLICVHNDFSVCVTIAVVREDTEGGRVYIDGSGFLNHLPSFYERKRMFMLVP